ncbi:unnamed protein product [Alopecurus aequalis]
MEQIANYRGIPSWETAVAAVCDVSSPSSLSWEEQAFARDAAANLLVWPPRSYSCTFCRREFRSAQALGGHMNVHRRDRARLRHQDDEVQLQEEPLEDSTSTYKQQAPISNPSTTTPSYRSTTINEEESKRHKVFISMAARGQKSIHHHDQDLDDESERRSKRRRVDQVAVPTLVRSMAAAVAVAAAPHEVFSLGHSEVFTKIIANPTSSSPDPPLVDQPEVDQFIKKQELVDLELRLGTNPKVA